MSYTCIEVRHPSPERTEVWLNRPDVRNAFNDAMIAELTQAFSEIARDPHVRVVLLTGHGKAFCAGADLNWMRAMADYSWEQNRADAQGLADMLWTLDQCPVPIVGRLHGDCYAGGMGLAAVCDVRLSSASMQFCLSEARLGLMPATISPYVVRAMGASAARRYFVTAERFSAAQAQAMGLVHEVCAPTPWTPMSRPCWKRWCKTDPLRFACASSWCAMWRAAPLTPVCAPKPPAA